MDKETYIMKYCYNKTEKAHKKRWHSNDEAENIVSG